MKIGLTGGIGSGKSYVCKYLQQHGIEVFDCDTAAKQLMRTSPTLRQQLTQLIGTDAYTADGKLNKAVVAQFLLASPANAKAIDAIVHPAVFDAFIESGLAWMESAILFETARDAARQHQPRKGARLDEPSDESGRGGSQGRLCGDKRWRNGFRKSNN